MVPAIPYPWGHEAVGHPQLCLAGCWRHGTGRGAHRWPPTSGFRRLRAPPGWRHRRLGGTAVPASRSPSWHRGRPYKSTPSVHAGWAFCIKTWFLAPKEGLLAAPGGHRASAVRHGCQRGRARCRRRGWHRAGFLLYRFGFGCWCSSGFFLFVFLPLGSAPSRWFRRSLPRGGTGRGGQEAGGGSRRRSDRPASAGKGRRGSCGGGWPKRLSEGNSEEVRQNESSSSGPAPFRVWGLPGLPQAHTHPSSRLDA